MQKTMTDTQTMSLKVSEQTIRFVGFIAVDAVFFTIIYLLSQMKALPEVDLTLLPFFALATLRMARTISFNEVATPLRSPFTKVTKDSCGAGDNVEPKGSGIQYVVGALLSCPICTSVWSALALYTTYAINLAFGRTLVYVLAFAGGSEMLHWGAEVLQWGGRAARVYAGAVSPDPIEKEENDGD